MSADVDDVEGADGSVSRGDVEIDTVEVQECPGAERSQRCEEDGAEPPSRAVGHDFLSSMHFRPSWSVQGTALR